MTQRRRKTSFVPRLIFQTACASVVPAIAASACGDDSNGKHIIMLAVGAFGGTGGTGGSPDGGGAGGAVAGAAGAAGAPEGGAGAVGGIAGQGGG